jgi:hypothetical protein
MIHFTKLLPVVLFVLFSAVAYAQFSWISTTNFKIHYVTAGAHAVNTTDNNNNNIPDYVEQAATSCENVFDIYINQMGFYKPPYDTGGRYNIYLVNFNALTPPLPANVQGDNIKRDSIGDNPNSSVSELYAATSYVRLRSNYAGLGLPYTPEQLMCINVAHEFFHVIQNGYNQFLSGYMKESMATHMADKLCGTDFRITQHFDRFFNEPGLPLNYDRDDNSSTQHHYSAWTFLQFAEEHYDSTFVKTLLAACMYKTDKPGEMTALDNTLISKGKNLADVFPTFCIANYLLTDITSLYPAYTYKDAAIYTGTTGTDGAHVADTLIYLGTPVIYNRTDNNLRFMRLSANYHHIESLDPISITVKHHQNISSIQVAVLKFNVTDNKYEIEKPAYRQLNSKKEFWLNIENASDYSHYVVVVTRNDRTIIDTTSIDYEIHLNKPDPWTVFDISPYTYGGYTTAGDIDIDAQTNDIWVTTGGILKYSNHKWSTVRDLIGFGDSYMGAVKSGNNMWFGYQNAGLIKKDAGNAFTEYTFNNTQDMSPGVTEIAYGGNNDIWKAGLYVIKFNGNTVQKFGIDEGLPTDGFNDIVVDANGAVWAVSNDGAGKYLSGNWSWYNTTSGIPDNAIWAIDAPPNGDVWIACGYGQIAKYNAGGFTEVLPNPMIFSGCTNPCIIYDLKCGPDNKVWFGQHNGGLWMFDGTNWKNHDHITTGIPEMFRVLKIAIEADSCVWLAMGEKIARYCYKNDVASGVTENILQPDDETIIYPNPAHQTISVKLLHNIIKTITLLNSLGQTIIHKAQPDNELNVASAENGLYFMQIATDNGIVMKRVLIVH